MDREYERLIAEKVEITTPIETEEWGERYFQVTEGPCGSGVIQARPVGRRSAGDQSPRKRRRRHGSLLGRVAAVPRHRAAGSASHTAGLPATIDR